MSKTFQKAFSRLERLLTGKPARRKVRRAPTDPDLYEPRFDEAFQFGMRFDPRSDPDPVRRGKYLAYQFGQLALRVPGDLAFFGVAYGVTPRIVYHAVAPRLDARRLVLIDPFTGAKSLEDQTPFGRYSDSADHVLKSMPGAPIDVVQAFIPEALSELAGRNLCFADLNTGDARSERQSLAALSELLSSGGIMLIHGYDEKRRDDPEFSAALSALPGLTINLQSGTAAFFKA